MSRIMPVITSPPDWYGRGRRQEYAFRLLSPNEIPIHQPLFAIPWSDFVCQVIDSTSMLALIAIITGAMILFQNINLLGVAGGSEQSGKRADSMLFGDLSVCSALEW